MEYLAYSKMLIKNRFLIKELLGQGSYGQVFLALDKKKGKNVALKIQMEASSGTSFRKEINVLENLLGTKGFPQILLTGTYHNLYFIAMEKYKESLQMRFEKRSKNLSIKELAFIGVKLLKLFKKLHSFGYLHRDLKPQNVLLNKNKLVLIDFGASTKFVDENNFHIKFKSNVGFVGNLAFSSCNAHYGLTLSRRDDLESLCYLLSYLMNKDLPWSRYFIFEDSDERIAKTKSRIKSQELFKSHVEFCEIFDYVKTLKFDEDPNYDFLIAKLKVVIQENNKEKLKFFKTEKTRRASVKCNKRVDKTKKHKKYSQRRAIEETIATSVLPEFKDRIKILKGIGISAMSTKVCD